MPRTSCFTCCFNAASSMSSMMAPRVQATSVSAEPHSSGTLADNGDETGSNGPAGRFLPSTTGEKFNPRSAPRSCSVVIR